MNQPPGDGESIPSSRSERDLFSIQDIALSRANPRAASPDSEELPSKVAEQLLHEVDEFLAEHEVRSKDELRFLLQKVDSAIAIDNNPKAKQLREELIRKFGDDAKE